MPAHGAEKYVSGGIASVLGQTLTDFELIVIDDASTDSTAAIVRGFDDKRVRYSRNDHRTGPGGARNVGLRLSRAQYVAFLDADDVAYRHRLATQLAYMEAHPKTALLGAGFDVIDSDGVVLSTLTRPSGAASVRLRMLFDNVIATSLAFARRATLFEAGLFDESIPVAEDYEMWSRLASRSGIARIPHVLGAYRDHSAGVHVALCAEVDNVRAEVAQRNLRVCLGLDVSQGVTRVLGGGSLRPQHSLEDAMTALVVLELLPATPPWQWADGAAEQRDLTRVLIEKLVTVVTREPRLHRQAMRVAATIACHARPEDVWDHATVRSAVRLLLAPGGRQRLRLASTTR